MSLAALSITSFTFADDSQATTPPTGTPPMMERSGGRKWDFITQFIRTDLTDAEKTALKALMDQHKTDLSTFFTTNGSKLTDPAVQAELKTLQDTFFNSLLTYVSADKVDNFKQAVANMKLPMMGRVSTPAVYHWNRSGSGEVELPRSGSGRLDNSQPHMNIPRKNQDQKENNSGKQNVLPASITTLLDTKLATFSDDAARTTWLQGVNAKIDVLLAKVTSQKSKSILEALKNLINDKLDAFSGNAVDQSVITNLLQ